MIALVSGATPTLKRHAHEGCWGRLVCPRSGDRLEELPGLPWAADNSAYSEFKERPFVAMMDRDVGHRTRCLFVVAPDVWPDAAATRALFDLWAPQIAARGYPVAYVLQNGQRPQDVPWERMAALFIGGTTEYKYGPEAIGYMQEAKARGKWLHVGRVNSPMKIHRLYGLGVDSVDGTGLSRWPDREFKHWRGALLNAQTALPVEHDSGLG